MWSAVSSALPSLSGYTILIDAGANIDPKARHLFQFAIMGHVYARDILRMDKGSWTKGANSVSAAVSHEVVEVLADPVACYYVDGLDDWMYAEVTRTYVLDADMQAFFERSNPWALKDMSARLLEAVQRGLWANPSAEMREALESAYLGSDEVLEGRAELDGVPV